VNFVRCSYCHQTHYHLYGPQAAQYHLAQLRHLYAQMVNGHVTDAAGAARGLLGPAIEVFEKLFTPTEEN
jgi:hypothetical protein